MNNEQIAALWLQIQSSKLRDLTDLALAQYIRQLYIKRDNNFKLNPRRVSEEIGINYNHTKKRLNYFVKMGILTRQLQEQQHKGYLYRLGVRR